MPQPLRLIVSFINKFQQLSFSNTSVKNCQHSDNSIFAIQILNNRMNVKLPICAVKALLIKTTILQSRIINHFPAFSTFRKGFPQSSVVHIICRIKVGIITLENLAPVKPYRYAPIVVEVLAVRGTEILYSPTQTLRKQILLKPFSDTAPRHLESRSNQSRVPAACSPQFTSKTTRTGCTSDSSYCVRHCGSHCILPFSSMLSTVSPATIGKPLLNW